MRRIVFSVMLFVSALVLCACDVHEMSSLSDLSKPYAGMYECTELTLGGKDMKEKFEFIRLELKDSGVFSLSYRTAEGNEGGVEGNYQIDTARGELTLTKQLPFRTASHVFPVKDGVIYADMNMNGALLHAEFAMP